MQPSAVFTANQSLRFQSCWPLAIRRETCEVATRPRPVRRDGAFALSAAHFNTIAPHNLCSFQILQLQPPSRIKECANHHLSRNPGASLVLVRRRIERTGTLMEPSELIPSLSSTNSLEEPSKNICTSLRRALDHRSAIARMDSLEAVRVTIVDWPLC